MAGTYTRWELINITEGKIEITQLEKKPGIIKTNKLEDITKVVFSLDELDNNNNLENGSLSNTLLTCHVTAYDDSMHFKPYAPEHKKVKNWEFLSLTLRTRHMKNNVMTDGLATTVVLHIREWFFFHTLKMEYGNKLNPTHSLRTPHGIKKNWTKVIVVLNPSETDQNQLQAVTTTLFQGWRIFLLT